MATKTLGVKFQVAGVKEATQGLDNLRKRLNQSQAENKKAVSNSNKIAKSKPSKAIRQRGETPYDYIDNYQRTVQAVKNKKYRRAADIYARPRFNTVAGGFFGGIGNRAGEKTFDKLEGTFRKLFGLKESRETVDLSNRTIQKIGISVNSAMRGRSGRQSQRDINLGVNRGGSGGGIVSGLLNQITMPLRTLQYSFYEGIGSNFGNQFAEGLSQVLNDDLDVSFERKGQVTGKAVSYTAREGVDRFRGDLSAVGDNFNDFSAAVEDGRIEQASQKFDTLFKSVARSITSIGDSYIRGFRRSSVEIEGLRQMDDAITQEDNQAPDLTGKKRVIYTVSGFAGEEGQRGKYMAEQLKPYVSDDTEVIGAENKFTDVLSPSDENPVLWGISALANLAKINLKGFNPDAVQLAAQVINTIDENPDVEVDLLGHSAGGFVVEETQEILNQLGYGDGVTSRIVGTPQMLGTIEAEGVDRIMGDGDFRIGNLEEALEYAGAATPTENVVGGVTDHFWQDYLNSDEFLEEALGDSLDPDKAKAQKRRRSPFDGRLIELETLYTRYISTIYQDLDELGDELSVAPDRIIARSRRSRLRDRGGKEVDRKLRDRDFKPVNLKEGTETAVLVAGGFSGARGRSGAAFARRLNELVDDDATQYVGVRNPFTDVLTAEDIRNPDPQTSIPKILEMFRQTHEIGYNPDAAEIAAQTMDLLSRDPNLNVKIAGYSGGGYVAEDVMELLKSQGADMSRVRVMGVGTPQLPGGINNREFNKIMGEGDPIMQADKLKELNNEVKKILGFDIFPELMSRLQNVEGVNSHSLDDYVANSTEVQDFFYGHIPNNQELIGNYARIESLKNDAGDLGGSINDIREDADLTSAEKFEALQALKQKYIEILQDIHELSKYSESIGGGEYFQNEREFAAADLETAGIIVEPPEPPETPEQETDDPWEEVEEEEAEVIESRSARLAEEYKQYLRNIEAQSSEKTKDTAKNVSTRLKSLDKNSQQNYLENLRRIFNTKARNFREAVRTGQLEVAQEQGENLIEMAALLKNLYAEMDGDEDFEGEVTSKLAGMSRYATSVQNEVVQGSNANGRIGEGLPAQFEEQLDLSEQDGSDFSEGFINGVLSNLIDAREAGQQLIEATEEGIRDAGEIRSPSRLAQRLGQWFSQGFGLGIDSEDLEERGRDAVDEAANGLRDRISQALDADNISGLIDTSGGALIQRIGSLLFEASQNEAFDSVLDTIGQLIGKVVRLFVTFKLLKVAIDAFGLGKLVEGFSNLPEEALNAAIAVETLDRRIIDMSGSALKGADNLAFITKEAKRLQKGLTDAKENYSQLLGATRDTTLEGVQTENIYTAFAATAKAKGKSAAEEDRLFKSVRSIIGKNIVSQEEVRQEIGELLGDFSQNLAEAYGVSVPQLNKMIENREVIATEALPKVAAVLSAKNDINGNLNTGAAAANRLDNSIVSFRENVGEALLPIQKFGNNFLAGFFNKLASLVGNLKGLVSGFFLSLFANLLRLQIFGQSVQKLLLGLIKLLFTMKTAIAIFAAEMVLVAAAWKTWENVIKILSSRYFPQINKDIDKITRGMKAYRQSIDEAKEAQLNLGNSKLQLNEGLKLPKFLQGLAGGERLNLDNMYRNRINWAGEQYQKYQQFLFNLSGTNIQAQRFRFKTRREQKEEQLKIDNSNLSVKGNQLLTASSPAFEAAKEITEYDKEIAAIQSARLKLLPGDTEALKASLSEERKINVLVDKRRRILSNYQQTLQTTISSYKTRLEDVQSRFLEGEIDEPTYKSERDNLTNLLEDTEDVLKGINSELNRVSKSLTQFQRNLRNSDERLEGVFAQFDRDLQRRKTGIIEAGIEDGAGSQFIQLELEEATSADLRRRINFLKTEISALESDLNSPELEPGIQRIKQQLAENNIPLNETSLSRIIEESAVKADRDAAQGLLESLKRETQLLGLEEQLASTLEQSRFAVVDFQRTIDDFFFNINQQIKEAQIEVLRVIDQIIQSQIRNKLTAALSPNGDSFVNSLIESTQSLLDQAASYAERVLGQRSARIQFASAKRGLQYELKDFERNIKGAGEALKVFEQRLRGDGNASKLGAGAKSTPKRPAESFRSKKVSPENAFAKKTVDIANRLGIDPEALMTIMLFESAGTLSPKIQGANVPGQGRGRGLIQFMPATAKGLGTSDAALAKMSDIDQLDYVEKYFAGFKNFGAGKLENLYAAVLAGNPLKVNASDGYVTARIGAQRMTKQYSGKAKAMLGMSDRLSVPSLPPSTSGTLPPPPNIKQAKKDTDFLIGKQEQQLDLTDSLIKNQEKEALNIGIANNLKTDRLKVDNQIVDSQFELTKLLDAGKDLLANYDFQSAPAESIKSLREVNNAFSDRGLQIFREITKYKDEINAIDDIISLAPSQSKMLRKAGRNQEADILIEKAAQAQLLLEPYQEMLRGLTAEYKNVTEAAEIALKFVVAQNKLKEEQERINERSLLVNQKATIAEQRGTLEAQRQLKLHQEDLRLTLKINELRQQNAPGEYLDSLIAGERRQAQVNTDNISYDSEIAELDLEKQLLDLNSGVGDKNAGFLSRYGFNLQADKIKRENAIAQENLRFERELIELRKQYVDRPEELEKFARAATQLNRVNLKSIEQEFKSLGMTIEGLFIESTQGFFNQVATNFFDGKEQRDSQLTQEKLRYAEELVQLENQYRDTPGQLAHMKNRARELNEQKLDKINSEFNIFSRVVELAGQAIIEFTKQIAAMLAQQAAAKFISSILGAAVGGATGGGVSSALKDTASHIGNDFGSGASYSAFTADKGVTVGDVRNYKNGDTINSRRLNNRTSSLLKSNFPGVAKAFAAEGEGAEIGVFHTGEELLSRKTGEAGRYQGLKARYGINPLEKILNYSDGGTVGGFDAEANILSGFSRGGNRIDLSGLDEARRNNNGAGTSKTLNITQQIFTPNQDSFVLNADQRNQDLMESLKRGF